MKIQKMDLLVSLYIFCILVSELMGGKTIPLTKIGSFQLNASVAIFVFPIIFTINDMITEVYGKERTKSLIRSGIVMIFLLILAGLFFTALPPSTRFTATEAAYDQIFNISTRIAAASLTAFTLAELIDVLVFVKIRQRLGKKALWLRNNVSNFIAQFFDTTLFMTLAFYNFALPFQSNWAFLLGLILPYWLLKCFVSVIETPFVYWGVAWLKKDKQA
ncbi:MAG TPA: queuosine precursor transporter [Thermoguttaceae bacterium]